MSTQAKAKWCANLHVPQSQGSLCGSDRVREVALPTLQRGLKIVKPATNTNRQVADGCVSSFVCVGTFTSCVNVSYNAQLSQLTRRGRPSLRYIHATSNGSHQTSV